MKTAIFWDVIIFIQFFDREDGGCRLPHNNIDTYQITQHHIREDNNLQNTCCHYTCSHHPHCPHICSFISVKGRAVAQAVSHWLPIAAAQVRALAACGVCGGQSGTGAGFLRLLWFPLPTIPPMSPSS
jgi:hypothetical protein